MTDHYYYFPFNVQETDSKWTSTVDHGYRVEKANLVAKYQHGHATISTKMEKYPEPTVNRHGQSYEYAGSWNPPTNPKKTYRGSAGEIVISCTRWKVVKSPATQDWDAKLGLMVEVKEKFGWEGLGGLPLGVVNENSVLFVGGHGNKESTKISNVEEIAHPLCVTLEPRELAAILISQGIKNNVIIKLTACYGGGGWTSDPNTADCFARSLAMKFNGHKKGVIVGGYPGTVQITSKGGMAKFADELHPHPTMVSNAAGHETGAVESRSAKDMIRYYDVDGKLTQRPDKK